MSNILKIGGVALGLWFLTRNKATAAGSGVDMPPPVTGGAANWSTYGIYQGSVGSLDESYLGVSGLPRGIRNNNPLNIKTYENKPPSQYWLKELSWFDNTDKVFCQFEFFPYGLRAAFKLMKNYKTNHGIDTIEGLIGRWNRPDNYSYMDFVAAGSGYSRTEILDLHDTTVLSNLIKPMFTFENGANYQLDNAQISTALTLL